MTVLILGAGIIGVSIAEALARRGARVIVLDMRGQGRGASQASAGILAPYIEAHEGSPLLALGVRGLDLFDEVHERITRVSGRTAEYARSGTLQIALSDADSRTLRDAKSWLDTHGVTSDWVDGAGLREVAPAVTELAAGGLLIPVHGFVNVRAWMDALSVCARLAGAQFESPVQVTAVERRGDTVRVTAGDRSYDADAVVLAGGSWSSRVRLGGLSRLPVRPVRGQLLHLRWPEPVNPPATVLWGSRCYTVPWSDGSLLVGATVEEAGFDERSTVDGVSALTNAVAELLPAARQASLEHVRVGLRPALPDELPAVGPFRAAPNIVAATGHYRNGVLLAPLTASIVADYLLDGVTDPAFAVMSPDRF